MTTHYVFDSLAEAQIAQALIHAQACLRGDAGHPDANTTSYAKPRMHPTNGRAAIPVGAGGVPTETYRADEAIDLPEPVALDSGWEPAAE